jgi:hypothetical protein
MLELRQTRYRGQNHPNDVCVIAHDVEELQSMVATWSEHAREAVSQYKESLMYRIETDSFDQAVPKRVKLRKQE